MTEEEMAIGKILHVHVYVIIHVVHMQYMSAVTPAVQLLQIQEVHSGPHSNA